MLAFGVHSRWGPMPVVLPPLLVMNVGGALCLGGVVVASQLKAGAPKPG